MPSDPYKIPQWIADISPEALRRADADYAQFRRWYEDLKQGVKDSPFGPRFRQDSVAPAAKRPRRK